MRKLVCLSVLAAVALLAVPPATRAGAAKPVIWPAADIKWSADPDAQGMWRAVLWGDPSQGAYGALHKWAAGLTPPAHTHTSDVHCVVVSGTITLSVEGGPMSELGPGSYGFVPGGAKHVSGCKAGADCVFFIEQPGKSDFLPAEPRPAPAK